MLLKNYNNYINKFINKKTHLPSLGAFLGELGEVDGRVRVLLLVLLPAGLHKEGVGRGLPPRLGRIFPHNFQSLKFVRVKKNKYI